MIDYLWETRQALIENFQTSMRAIRLLMGYSIAELAEYIGVTRQTINNLETGKSKMSAVQFLSLAAVVDGYIASNGDMYQAIETILDGNGRKLENCFETSFSGFSLIKRWFLLFEREGAEIVSGLGEALNAVQLRQMVQEYKIFLDDTALLSDYAEAFITSVADYLISENAKIIIPLRSIERVQEKTMDPSLINRAVKALRLLNWMQQKKIIQIRGEDNDSNLYDTILSVFLKFRGTYRLCLITQDSLFADKVLQLNETRNSEGFKIVVGYIVDGGQLVMHNIEDKTRDVNADEKLNTICNESTDMVAANDNYLISDETAFTDASGLPDEMLRKDGSTGEKSGDIDITAWEYL
jgi:DNA-binding XRE family transcriptional regulator